MKNLYFDDTYRIKYSGIAEMMRAIEKRKQYNYHSIKEGISF